MSRRPLTDSENQLMRDQWEAAGVDGLARMLNRSPATITAFARKLGLIESLARPPWSAVDDAYLCAHYPDGDDAAIAAHLGRTIDGLKSRAGLLGVKKSPQFRAARARQVGDKLRQAAAERRKGQQPQRCAPSPRPNSGGWNRTGAADRLFSMAKVGVDQASSAADFLRRFSPVIRCDGRGRYHERGNFWRIGLTVLNREAIMARAERKGWVA